MFTDPGRRGQTHRARQPRRDQVIDNDNLQIP